MAKKKNKNSNYVTEKTTQAKLEKEKAKKAKRVKRIVKEVAMYALVIVIAAGIFTGLGFAFGWFNYSPTTTSHALISVEGYDSIHVELYGEDAPKTVEKFLDLVEDGHYNGKSFDKLLEDYGMLCSAGTTNKITGEFENNGVENKVPFIKGTLAMYLPTEGDNNSANGSFFILGENQKSLGGSYAAFGRVQNDGLETLEAIFEAVKGGAKPKITSITTHEAH